ncbi:d8287be3-edee-45a6-ad09-f51801c7012f [Sclerotinia trifoliorum]|uniref:D8287be3-edee-45a6-ad09-f51801c7012f n=1 Tax=Sclerotinia trifoliorum TaxID=28548 RepID=A0A8H2VX09_9HELO|nr:d8287be3-edee-45a6-ad09-f51801c7012f [Sclerotinia trifoliorum]
MSHTNRSENGPVTEVARLTLKDGIKVADLEGDGEYAKIWRGTLDTIASQKGYNGSYYGAVIEETEKEVLAWYIDWTSLAHHKSFMESPAYPSLLENISSIIQGADIKHVEKLNVKEIAGKGVMEVAVFFDVEDVFIEGINNFIGTLKKVQAQKKIAGFLGLLEYGEVIEKIAKNSDAKEEEKGRAVVFVVGWENVAAHTAFQGTQEFKDTIGYLTKGISGFDVSHVALKSA